MAARERRRRPKRADTDHALVASICRRARLAAQLRRNCHADDGGCARALVILPIGLRGEGYVETMRARISFLSSRHARTFWHGLISFPAALVVVLLQYHALLQREQQRVAPSAPQLEQRWLPSAVFPLVLFLIFAPLPLPLEPPPFLVGVGAVGAVVWVGRLVHARVVRGGGGARGRAGLGLGLLGRALLGFFGGHGGPSLPFLRHRSVSLELRGISMHVYTRATGRAQKAEPMAG